MQINEKLKAYCEQNTFMRFVDATQMTYDSETGQYNSNLFVSDQIHLNEQGQSLWAKRFIKPAIASIIESKQWSDLLR